MDSPAQIDGGSSKRNYIIPFKNMSYTQKTYSKSQNHHKSTARPNFTIIPNSFDIKKHANPTAPSESPQKPKIKFEHQKKSLKFGKLVSNMPTM